MRAPWTPVAGSTLAVPAGQGPAVEPAAELPPVPGFTQSPFGPLVREVVRRCVGEPGAGAVLGVPGARTAVVLGTGFGDTVTHDLASERLARGLLPSPLLFYQAVPTAIVGHVCHEYGITGPVFCVSVLGQVHEELLPVAATMLAAEDVEQVLVVAAELGPTPRTAHAAARLEGVALPRAHVAVALLLRPAPSVPRAAALPLERGGDLEAFGSLAGLARLARSAQG